MLFYSFLYLELNIRSNQLIDMPSSMGNLTNLIILDLNDNPWDSKTYNGDDIPNLLEFLRGINFIYLIFILQIILTFHILGKKDVVKTRRQGTVSKAFRRSETKKQLEEMMAKSNSTVSEFVMAETSRKKLYHLKGLYFLK